MSALRIAHPGRETVVIPEVDAETGLTDRQRAVLHVVRAFAGNRRRAARALGVNVRAVQISLRYAKAAGVRVPEGAKRGTDLTPRSRRWRVRP